MAFDVDVARRMGEVEVACAFAVGDGLTALLGRSGAGKTSVLNMIAGLLTPDRGHVRVAGATLFDAAAGVDVPPERRRAGYVFQDARLFPHRSVLGNLTYGDPAGVRAGVLKETIALLGLGALLERRPRTLSGGEARRVAIGRALLADPAFLLLDEPLTSLDPARREETMELIERLRDHARLPILMVTHDADEVRRLARHIIEIESIPFCAIGR